ncbi:MAG: sulfurtransferase [bacterium]|nr:sulfurtransferase [bacterium]
MSKFMRQNINRKMISGASFVSRAAAAVLAVILLAAPVSAQEFETKTDVFELSLSKTTELGLYLNSDEGHRFKTENPKILFLDVRTRAEVNFLGMPDVADANIPIKPITTVLAKNGKAYQRVDNKEFIPAVADLISRKKFDDDPVIFVMCRNGKGSAIATNRLAEAGYTKVYSIVDGYEGDFDANGKRTVNGWKNAGLPWSYGIGNERAYSYKPASKRLYEGF